MRLKRRLQNPPERRERHYVADLPLGHANFGLTVRSGFNAQSDEREVQIFPHRELFVFFLVFVPRARKKYFTGGRAGGSGLRSSATGHVLVSVGFHLQYVTVADRGSIIRALYGDFCFLQFVLLGSAAKVRRKFDGDENCENSFEDGGHNFCYRLLIAVFGGKILSVPRAISLFVVLVDMLLFVCPFFWFFVLLLFKTIWSFVFEKEKELNVSKKFERGD